MHHLGTLRILNYVMAGIHAMAVVMLAVFTIIGGAFLKSALAADPAFAQPGGPPPELIGGIFIVIFVLAGAILVLETALMIVAGRAVGNGRGRILQTILAVLQIASFPVGTAYAIYALWVCWSHEPTKSAFDRSR